MVGFGLVALFDEDLVLDDGPYLVLAALSGSEGGGALQPGDLELLAD